MASIIPLYPVSFALEIAAICEADADEIADVDRADDNRLQALATKGDCHEVVYSALREINGLIRRPISEASRLRRLAEVLRDHDNGERL